MVLQVHLEHQVLVVQVELQAHQVLMELAVQVVLQVQVVAQDHQDQQEL